MTPLLEGKNLCFAYDERIVLDGVNVALAPGELVALVGPNGAGKSTLLKVLLGWLEPDKGDVSSQGSPLSGLTRREIATRIAFLPQETKVDFAFTARELVTMGRTPHLGRWTPEGPADLRAVEHALDATETRALEGRPVSELSGGERQRVHLARALAQETGVLLLDEPTASLDIEHQLALLELLRRLVRGGKAALVALHDLSLAARYADRVVVLAGHRVVADGPPRVVFTEELLERWFRIRAIVRESAETGGVEVVPVEPVSQ